MATEIEQGVSAVAESLGVVRPDGHCTIEAINSVLRALERAQCVAAIVQGFGIIRLECDRPVIALERLVMPFDRRQNGTVIGMGDSRSRICLERAGYQLEPLGGFSALMQENAAQMERVEIAGLNGEDLPVQRLGFLQLPALMVRGRAPKRVYDDGICGGRLDLRFRHGLEGVAKATRNATSPRRRRSRRIMREIIRLLCLRPS